MKILNGILIYMAIFLATVFSVDTPLELGHMGIVNYDPKCDYHEVIVGMLIAVGMFTCSLCYLNSGSKGY